MYKELVEALENERRVLRSILTNGAANTLMRMAAARLRTVEAQLEVYNRLVEDVQQS